MKPSAARLVDDLEVDVNVYPPGSGWGGRPGKSLLEVVGNALKEALADYLARPEKRDRLAGRGRGVAGLLVWAFLAAPGLAATEAEIKAILADRIDDAQRSVGMVVGLIDADGKTVVGHGRRGPGDPAIPDGDTVFEIGSVTKVFTAILLAEMAGRKEVAIEAPAARFLPDSLRFPGNEDEPITLYHLATHTSGLPRMPGNFAPADPANPYADYSVQQMYEFLSGYEPARAPGETAEYSNLGVGLLGHVLAKAAGSDYETLVKERVTGPLKMTDTAITLTAGMKERLAVGHDASLKPTPNWDIPTLAGAGALQIGRAHV